MSGYLENIAWNKFSFAEIVEGPDSCVSVTYDGLLHAVNLVMVVTGKDCNHANACLRDLNPSLFDKTKLITRGRSKLITFEDSIQLIMILPGKRAKKLKAQFANIIHRYLAGDKTLILEINTNAESSSGIAELARESAGMPNESETAIGDKRSREEGGCALVEACNNAFYYQKKALELRYKGEFERLEHGEVDEEERLQEENRNLEEENEKDLEHIKQLELELKAMDSELPKTDIEYKERVEAVRILSGLYLQEGFSKPQYQISG